MNYSDEVLALNPELHQTNPDALRSPSKYGNAKTEAAGMLFDSGKEAAMVGELILLEQGQKIFALRLQVRFPLRAGINYVADAVYLDEELKVHVVDAKGFRTDVYRMKRKLFRDRYQVDIEEV